MCIASHLKDNVHVGIRYMHKLDIPKNQVYEGTRYM